MKTKFLILHTVLISMVVTFSRAGAYTPPPSWNPMSMPSVTYNVTTNRLAVQSKPAAVLNTNVNPATSQPGPGIGSFDPGQVWSILNGTAFSRMLGWNDPVYIYADIPEKDPTSLVFQIKSIYGPDAAIWIESTAKSPGINAYLAVGMWGINADSTQTVDYANPSGVPYSGIFGTNGSSAKWSWDGYMDHNTYSVSFSSLNAPNQPFSATYRLYVGDAAGNELTLPTPPAPPVGFSNSAATTTTWYWTGPAFVFTSQYGISPGTGVESDIYTAAGIATPGTSGISVTNGEYAISTNGGASWNPWTSSPGIISNTNKVKVRQTSAAGHGVTTITTLAIPGVPGPGEFRLTTTTIPDPAWPIKIMGGFDQPSLAYAYSLVPDNAEPNNAVIMIKDGTRAESGFIADRNITVTLAGGYNADFSLATGASVIQGPSNVLSVRSGKVIVDRVFIRAAATP